MRKQRSDQAEEPLFKRKRGRPRKASYTEIKRAIRRFISRTEKIVQKVTPQAQILISREPARKRGRPRKNELRVEPASVMRFKRRSEEKFADKTSIVIPQFREVSLADFSDSNQSDEDTSDEAYEALHDARERVEMLITLRPELRRIKSNGRSTNGIHVEERTSENIEGCLNVMTRYMNPTALNEYQVEGVDIVPWPEQHAQDSLVVRYADN